MDKIKGGVTAAKGFSASGVYCGIRKNPNKKDLALICSDRVCSAAGVYTTNLVKGAPILVTRAHIADGTCRAIICNSGNANTCNADGVQIAEEMCAALAAELGISETSVAVASTGVIGQPLNVEVIKAGIPALCAALSPEGGDDAAEAILTTDLVKKESAYRFEIGGVSCTIGGIAKGSGMIKPNMATMLSFITTDAAVAPELLRSAVKAAADKSFNRVSVDGDTSTNDTLLVLANGASGAAELTEPSGAGYEAFFAALCAVCTDLARMMARDGEGATKLIECRVSGAATEADAVTLAKSVIMSNLVKAAMFGADANWGRVLCALGYAGVPFDPQKTEVVIRSKKGDILVCSKGASVDFSEERAKEILLEDEILLDVTIEEGTACGNAYGCDLTYDYVKINGDYRT